MSLKILLLVYQFNNGNISYETFTNNVSRIHCSEMNVLDDSQCQEAIKDCLYDDVPEFCLNPNNFTFLLNFY